MSPSTTATGKFITSVTVGSKKDVDLAVDAAKNVKDGKDHWSPSIH